MFWAGFFVSCVAVPWASLDSFVRWHLYVTSRSPAPWQQINNLFQGLVAKQLANKLLETEVHMAKRKKGKSRSVAISSSTNTFFWWANASLFCRGRRRLECEAGSGSLYRDFDIEWLKSVINPLAVAGLETERAQGGKQVLLHLWGQRMTTKSAYWASATVTTLSRTKVGNKSGEASLYKCTKFACTGIDGGSMPNMCPAMDVGILGIAVCSIKMSRRGRLGVGVGEV
jgi:hypothetical protein